MAAGDEELPELDPKAVPFVANFETRGKGTLHPNRSFGSERDRRGKDRECMSGWGYVVLTRQEKRGALSGC